MSAALIEARDLGVTFRRQEVPALSGVDLVVEAGCAIGIVGESGSGKTTLGKVLAGAAKQTSGEVLIKGKSWQRVRRRDPERRSVQMIFQDPYGSLNPSLSAVETVAEVVRLWNEVSRQEARTRARSLLDEVGLPSDAAERRPRQLSGGQCQRVGIARALACDPAVLIADEPTSALDVSVQAQIVNLLLELRRHRNLSLLMISHDLDVINVATDETVVLYAGRVVERGPTEALLTDPRHHYTRLLLDSRPSSRQPLRAAHHGLTTETGCAFVPRCPAATAACLPQPPPLVDIGHEVACVNPIGSPGGDELAMENADAAGQQPAAHDETEREPAER